MSDNRTAHGPIDVSHVVSGLYDFPCIITGGPVRVDVMHDYKLVAIENLVTLINTLTPEECVDLERDLQSVIDIWCKEKGIVSNA